MWTYTTRKILRFTGEGGRKHYIPSEKIECISERRGGGSLIHCAGNSYVVPELTPKEIAEILEWEQ